MPTIAIANQKGGVGKTTIAVHVAHYLTQRSKRVILIDADPQANATSWLCAGNTNHSAFAKVFVAGSNPDKELLAIPNTAALFPGASDTGDIMDYLTVTRKPFTTIADTFKPLAEMANYTLIDMPPSKAAGFHELLYFANMVLVPTQLERFSLEGVLFMGRTCQELQDRRGHGPRLLGIVPNMVRRQTVEHQAQMEALVNLFAGTVWPPIPLTIKVSEAASQGKTTFDLMPDSPVTNAMEQIGLRILENAPAG